MHVSADMLLESLFDGVYYVDTERRILFWNKAAERITGYRREEVLGSRCADDILRHTDHHGKDLCGEACPLAATMVDGTSRELNAIVQHKQGFRVPVQIKSSPVRDEGGKIIGAVEIFTDNANAMEVLREFEQLKHDVLVDALTGVGNRRYGESMLDSMMAEWQRNGTVFGVLFVDIDHFKNVNDSYGHETGDEVLVMIGTTLTHVVRKLDVVARWGGEEFITLLPGAKQTTLIALSERIRAMVEQTYLTKGEGRIGVTVSIGGTLVAADDNAATVIARADGNMYQSKKEGRNRATIA